MRHDMTREMRHEMTWKWHTKWHTRWHMRWHMSWNTRWHTRYLRWHARWHIIYQMTLTWYHFKWHTTVGCVFGIKYLVILWNNRIIEIIGSTRIAWHIRVSLENSRTFANTRGLRKKVWSECQDREIGERQNYLIYFQVQDKPKPWSLFTFDSQKDNEVCNFGLLFYSLRVL